MQAAAPTRQPVNARWLSAVPRSAFCENLGGASHVEIFGKEHMFCLMIVYYFYYILYYFYFFFIIVLYLIVMYYCILLLFLFIIVCYGYYYVYFFFLFGLSDNWIFDSKDEELFFASPKQVTWNFYHKNLCPRYKDTLWGAQ